MGISSRWQTDKLTLDQLSNVPSQAGQPFNTVTIAVVHLGKEQEQEQEQKEAKKQEKPQELVLPVSVTAGGAWYYSSLTWANSSTLAVVLVSRAQTHRTVLLCGLPNFSCREVFQDSRTWGLQRGQRPPIFSATEMVVRAPLRDGADGYFQVRCPAPRPPSDPPPPPARRPGGPALGQEGAPHPRDLHGDQGAGLALRPPHPLLHGHAARSSAPAGGVQRAERGRRGAGSAELPVLWLRQLQLGGGRRQPGVRGTLVSGGRRRPTSTSERRLEEAFVMEGG